MTVKQWVFVGGTGRSGSHIMARLLAQNPNAVNFEEVRWLVDPYGSCDYVNGKASAGTHKIHMRRYYDAYRVNVTRKDDLIPLKQRGFFRDPLPWDLLDSIYLGESRISETRAFADWFFGPVLGNLGAEIVIEKTPPMVMQARELERIFDNSYFIHMIRDPRDIASSLLDQAWGPDSEYGCVRWIGGILYKARQAMPEKHLVVSLEQVAEDPSGTMARICDFLGWPDGSVNAGMFDPEKAHIGRWADRWDKIFADKIYEHCAEHYEYFLTLSQQPGHIAETALS